MVRRHLLQSKLEEVMGSRNVYYQPPSNLRMNYPCIVYELGGSENRYADDIKYKHNRVYQVTVIDRNPDSEIPDRVGALPYSSMDTTFVSENLNHFVFTLHF